MNKYTISFSLAFITLLMSCGDNKAASPKAEIPEIPEAMQEGKIDKIKYSRGEKNYVEELFNELLENNQELKQLNEEIVNMGTKSNDLVSELNVYKHKSESYYNSAHSLASQISDSALSKRISAIIDASGKKYNTANAELEALVKVMSTNTSSINDNLLAIKVVLTLPMLEKYQTGKRPESKAFKNLIEQQEDLLKREEKLIK